MHRRKLPANAPCPCESGKKYKLCCSRKGVRYLIDDDGDLYREVRVDAQLAEILDAMRRSFVERFGREPGPDDPVFFDLPPAEHLEAEVVQGMRKAGLNPALIHAFEKTGLLVTEDNRHLIPEADLAEWDAAVEEYERRRRG